IALVSERTGNISEPHSFPTRTLFRSQQWPAADIARMVLDGFDDYREHFRQITDGARARFEQAQWQATQVASAARINIYEEKVSRSEEHTAELQSRERLVCRLLLEKKS